MRISTSAFYQQGVDAIQRHESALARVQNQLSSGLRFQRAGEDPTAMAQVLGVDKALADTAQWQSNIGSLRDRLNLEESALSNVVDSMDRIRELSLQANTATVSDSDRVSIAKEMQQHLQSILDQANARDGQGRYLFAGSRDQARPFERIGGAVQYQGDSLVSMLQVGATREILAGDSGSDAFVALKSGDGRLDATAAAGNSGLASMSSLKFTDSSAWDEGSYALSFSGGNYEVRDGGGAVVASGAYGTGDAIQFRGISLSLTGTPADGDRFQVGPAQPQDVFATVQKLVGLVSSYGRTPAQKSQDQTAYFSSLRALDAAIDHIGNIRGGVGARLAALDDSESQLLTRSTQLQETLSGLRSTDYAEAATRMSQTELALQAAQQSYLRVQGLSLFDLM